MNKEQIHEVLDNMLVNPKSKNFLNHLVRSYFPVINVKKVVEKPKTEFKCVLTREPLASLEDVIKSIASEDIKNEFSKHVIALFDEKIDKAPTMVKLVHDKKLAVTGKDTNTYMSFQAFQEFYDWIITKSLKGDKHINWLLGSIKRASLIDRAENIADTDVQRKVFNFKKKESAKVATYKISDSSDVLAKLKAKMESSEK
jgi:hypothetical protein